MALIRCKWNWKKFFEENLKTVIVQTGIHTNLTNVLLSFLLLRSGNIWIVLLRLVVDVLTAWASIAHHSCSVTSLLFEKVLNGQIIIFYRLHWTLKFIVKYFLWGKWRSVTELFVTQLICSFFSCWGYQLEHSLLRWIWTLNAWQKHGYRRPINMYHYASKLADITILSKQFSSREQNLSKKTSTVFVK